MDKQLKKIGFQLREAREHKHKRREEIADQIGIHVRTLAKWENGQVDPPIGKIMAVSEALETPMQKILGLEAQDIKGSFINNQQEGDTCILNSGTISFDKETMEEINRRFAFLEKLIMTLQEEKKLLSQQLEASLKHLK